MFDSGNGSRRFSFKSLPSIAVVVAAACAELQAAQFFLSSPLLSLFLFLNLLHSPLIALFPPPPHPHTHTHLAVSCLFLTRINSDTNKRKNELYRTLVRPFFVVNVLKSERRAKVIFSTFSDVDCEVKFDQTLNVQYFDLDQPFKKKD